MDKSALLASRLPTGEVDIPGVGTVVVRGLSRQEMISVGEIGDQLAQERRTLSLCMVDPRLTEDEVRQWQEASPAAEINAVAQRINELSGIGPAAAKEAYKSDGSGSIA